MRAGGFCHYCIMHADSCYTLNHKVQATISTVGHALYKHYNNGIISVFLKMDAGGGLETVLPLGVALPRLCS